MGMIRIVARNVCFWQHRKDFQSSWDYLCKEINPDIALVQEAVPPLALDSRKNFVWREIDPCMHDLRAHLNTKP